jgi:EmrB/QacA subfamily drug resistance transporter
VWTGRTSLSRTFAVLTLAAVAYSVAQTALIPALTDLQTGLHTSATNVAWTLTSYLISAAIFTPVFGRLGDMFGKRALLVISLVGFGVGGAISALGNSLDVVLIGRVVQGVGGGVLPLCFGIVRDEFPAERRVASIGMLSATTGVGSGAGLLVGGVLVDHASFHWIFWVGAISAAVASVGAFLFVPESPVRAPARVDVAGALVLGIGLTAPLVAVSEATDWGWSDTRTLALFAAGAAVLVGFVLLEQRRAEPLIDMVTLREPAVLITNVATACMGFGMFGSFILVSEFVQSPRSTGYGLGVDATRTGLIMVPGSLVMILAGILAARISQRFGSRVSLAVGALITALGLVLAAIEHGSQGAIIGWVVVMNVGIGLGFAAMPNLIVDAVRPTQTGEATAVNNLVRSVGSSVGAQVAASILTAGVVASAFPTEHAFEAAFLVTAAVSVASGLAAFCIPRRTARPLPYEAELSPAPVGAGD